MLNLLFARMYSHKSLNNGTVENFYKKETVLLTPRGCVTYANSKVLRQMLKFNGEGKERLIKAEVFLHRCVLDEIYCTHRSMGGRDVVYRI